MHITLGSTSSIKSEAVTAGCQVLGLMATIETVNVASGVSAQPMGRTETQQGAQNRAAGAARARPGSYAIGIENGLRETTNGYEDWAVVSVLRPDGTEVLLDSRAIAFPTSIVEEARARGFATTTAGEILAERTGCNKNDPHSFLTHDLQSRLSLLTSVLIEALTLALTTHNTEFIMKTTHTVTIGTVTRTLPIREVAPGVRVALFNPLGDWELNEAIGAELAKLIPAGTEVLVMPDGKAQALLHVLGRVAKLPTIVARKEHKPYMAEPVLKVTVKSITTNKEQALFLGADDAALLAGKKVVIVDDVVSTGGTLLAMQKLLAEAGAELVAVMAAFTEGAPRSDVIALGHLPLF